MKKNVAIVALGVLVVINLVMNFFDRTATKEVAYVRSQDLVYAFDGMKEMQLKFQEKTKKWEATQDSLRLEYERALVEYNEVFEQLNFTEKQTREQLLLTQKKHVLEQAEQMDQFSLEEEDRMLKGVLNQVNSFVEEYGKEKGYDLILGTTMSGSILYGADGMDITEELIKEINKHYYGK